MRSRKNTCANTSRTKQVLATGLDKFADTAERAMFLVPLLLGVATFYTTSVILGLDMNHKVRAARAMANKLRTGEQNEKHSK